MTCKIIIGILILIAGIGYSCASSKVKRITLFEGKTYPWKVVYVKEDNFPAGKYHHYEVLYDNEPLMIPKELFGSINDISTFTNANGFEIQDDINNSVLLTIENITKKDNGSLSHQFISFFVTKINDGKKKTTFWVCNLNREKIAEFEH